MQKSKKIRPSEAAVEQIEWYIRKNNLKPHTKLPGEREMCEVWGFNRSTLRSAIQRLSEEQIVYSERGSGTYVAPPKLERNLQDTKSTSESMRGSGYFLWTEVLSSRVENSSKYSGKYISSKLDIPENHRIFCLKRLRVRNHIPLMIETSYSDYERCVGIENHNFSEESLYKVFREMGVDLAEGEEQVGVTYATEEEANLLKVEPGAFMFFISGIIRDSEGKPVEFFKLVANPKVIRFTSTLKRLEVEQEGES